MSANFPTSPSDNGADSTGRASTQNKNAYDEVKSTAKKTATTLRDDLGSLKSDLDALLARASTLSERELSDAYARLMTNFTSLRYAARGMAAEAGRQINQGVDMTCEYVKDRPLQSVGMAAGVGLLLGLLIGRR
jgi:ElaB/YqjD/DUF883 family membrane-anchored ribosome-binding protein